MAERADFPSTLWTTLRSQPREARARVFERYRRPILLYIENQGFQAADAEDLAQEVLARVCREDFLSKADRSKGRFRSLLLAVTRHVMLDHRRAVSRRPVARQLDERLPAEAMRDEGFDDLWIQNLVRLALERLMKDTAQGGPKYYDAFVLVRMQQLPYVEAARRLGVTSTDVTNWVHQARKKLRESLGELVREYSSSDQEHQAEISFLASCFKG